MRVRYQMVGEEVDAICDMTEKKARELFGNLEKNGLCEWAELVGEDDEDYMKIISSFDHIQQARLLKKIQQEILG